MEPDQKRKEIEQNLKRKALAEKLVQTAKFMTAHPPSPTTTGLQKNHKPVSNINRSKSGDSTRNNTNDSERVVCSDISEGQQTTAEGEIDVSDKIINTVDQVTRDSKRRKIEKDSLIKDKDLIVMGSRIPEKITEDSHWTKKFAEIDSRLTTVQIGIAQIISLLEQGRGEVIPQGTTFADKYSITLPCLTMDDVTALNKNLESNSCRQEFNNLINGGVDVVGGLSKSTTRMLKICLRRQIALNLTAVKQMPKKVRIREMPFAKIIESVLKTKFPAVTEKDIWSAMGDALSNSKDWEGYRQKRVKKNPAAAGTAENSKE